MMHDSICCRVHLQREQTEQWTVFLSLLDRGLQMLPDGRARRPHREHSGGTRGAVELINEPDVDGFLIGGSALKVDELTRICKLTLETTA